MKTLENVYICNTAIIFGNTEQYLEHGIEMATYIDINKIGGKIIVCFLW